MYRAPLARLTVSMVAILMATRTSEAAWARFTFNSQPGDFIGQGQVRNIIYDTMQGQEIYVGVSFWLPTGEPTMVDFDLHPFDPATNAFLTFATRRLGIGLQPGFYPNAQLARFEALGRPGLDVGFQNRACNSITGNFTISDIVLAPNGSIDRFAASFEQHCEGATPALFGTLTYYAIPEPATVFSLSACAVAAIVRRGRQRRSAGARCG